MSKLKELYNNFAPTFFNEAYIIGRRVVTPASLDAESMEDKIEWEFYCHNLQEMDKGKHVAYYDALRVYDVNAFKINWVLQTKFKYFPSPEEAHKVNKELFDGVMDVYKVDMRSTLIKMDKHNLDKEKHRPMRRSRVRYGRRKVTIYE